MSQNHSILFDISKNELFQLNDNYKSFHRKIKTIWKVEQYDILLLKYYFFI